MAAVVKQISMMTSEVQGWVVTSNTARYTTIDEEELMRGSISIRVPSEQFDTMLQRIRALAETITNENVTGQDVTEEYTGLQSNLRNLQAAEAQLQQLMESATDVDDVLSVYDELLNIRGQIEVIQGRIRFF